MATPNTQIPLSGLARKLVQDGLLSDAQAQQAIDSLNAKEVGGRVLTVNQARERSPRPPRRNSGGYRRS